MLDARVVLHVVDRSFGQHASIAQHRHPPAQRAKRIDVRLPDALIKLPTQISGVVPGSK